MAVLVTGMTANYISAFFAVLALIFLILSATGNASLRRKIQRRVGIIFAAVALLIFFMHPR
jgi:ABC-type microcin C transport system permease subunit YejB